MCGHVEFLMRPQNIPGTKRQVKFLDSGYIVNMKSGIGEWKPILRGMKDTPSGKITTTSDWHPLSFCPVCGVKLEDAPVEVTADA